MHETGLGKSLECQEKQKKTKAWFSQKEQGGRRPCLNQVALRCKASTLPLLLVQDVKHRVLVPKTTEHGSKCITSRWRSSPSLSDGSGVMNAAAVHAASHGHAGSECFSSSSASTSSSTFLLHAALQPGSSPACHLSRAAGRSKQARPRLFQQSQRPTERRWRQQQPSSAQSDITASSHPCRTGPQRRWQDRDAAALVRHLKNQWTREVGDISL